MPCQTPAVIATINAANTSGGATINLAPRSSTFPCSRWHCAPRPGTSARGSRRTHDDRLAWLREAGLTAGELSRLRSPIGLDLGARSPEETAVSIAAELIQLRWGGTGQALTDTQGRIHHQLALS